MDTYDRLHPLDLEQAAVVQAIFLYNTSEREAMMPRKPFPHPENERKLTAPLENIYPNVPVPAPDNGKPAPPTGNSNAFTQASSDATFRPAGSKPTRPVRSYLSFRSEAEICYF
jgi:hypothetical protein